MPRWPTKRSRAVRCGWCSKEFQTTIGRIARGDGKFCSISCSRTYNASGERNPNWVGGIDKNEVRRRYRSRNPEKNSAHLKVWRAVKAGKISKTPCVTCGDEKSQAHHEDYSKPLEVVWLCHKCHRKTHQKEKKNRITKGGRHVERIQNPNPNSNRNND